MWQVQQQVRSAQAFRLVIDSDSIATRIAYAFMLLVNSIISWLMLTDWALQKLEHLTLDYMNITCQGRECFGYIAVQRINFGLGLFHLILAIVLMGVKSSKDPRAGLQNGFWGPKIIVWFAFLVLTFLIPESFFRVWGKYFSFIGAMLFVLLGLILLVDLAHTYAEWCLEKIETYETSGWRALLIGSTLGMYALSIAATVVMYIYFAPPSSDCKMNKAAITINLLVFLGISFLSIHPTIQEFNPKAGLAQAAIVAVYCTYLTLSAVSMEPDNDQCNPLSRANGARTTTTVLGAIVTMLTIAYTTTRAATQGFALGGSSNSYVRLGDEEGEHGLIDQQPSASRREMRAEALRAAVQAGSLPASALDEDDDDSDDGKDAKDDERSGTQYNYALFHVIFFLGTCWVATLLTQSLDGVEMGDGTKKGLVAIGRTYWASWVKIVSAWVCYTVYGWSLLAPVVLPDRFGY